MFSVRSKDPERLGALRGWPSPFLTRIFLTRTLDPWGRGSPCSPCSVSEAEAVGVS